MIKYNLYRTLLNMLYCCIWVKYKCTNQKVDELKINIKRLKYKLYVYILYTGWLFCGRTLIISKTIKASENISLESLIRYKIAYFCRLFFGVHKNRIFDEYIL